MYIVVIELKEEQIDWYSLKQFININMMQKQNNNNGNKTQ